LSKLLVVGSGGNEVPGLLCTNRKLPEAPFPCNLGWSWLPVPPLPGSSLKVERLSIGPSFYRALLWQEEGLLEECQPPSPPPKLRLCSGVRLGLIHPVRGESPHLCQPDALIDFSKAVGKLLRSLRQEGSSNPLVSSFFSSS